MPDYSQAKIYKLTSTKTSICYIGSTTLTLKKRLSTHRSNYKQYKKGKALYKTSFEIIKKDPYAIRIKLLESYPCKNKFELQNREKSQIKKHPKCINHNLKNEQNTNKTKKKGLNMKRTEGQRKHKLFEKAFQIEIGSQNFTILCVLLSKAHPASLDSNGRSEVDSNGDI